MTCKMKEETLKPAQDRIERGLWWDYAWRIVEGCTPVSPGCANCWSASQAHIRSKQNNAKIAASFGGVTNDDGNWNGHIKLLYDNLQAPLKRRKPTVYAVWNDLFHEDVPFEFIDKAFAVMALCPQHLFMVLTKRPERMQEYIISRNGKGNGNICDAINELPTGIGDRRSCLEMPLFNVWLGVTAENQEQADKRIPILLDTPAAKRFVSIEPMLGPISLAGFDGSSYRPWLETKAYDCLVDLIICGGESGHNARPLHPGWVRLLRDQCAAARVPLWFKQWGEWALADNTNGHRPVASWITPDGRTEDFNNPEELFDVAGASLMVRVGKAKAGRLLDGAELLQWPEG